jgi:hypothetical protein
MRTDVQTCRSDKSVAFGTFAKARTNVGSISTAVHSPYHTGTYCRTFLLTPHSTVLLDKLTGLQLVKESPHFMEPEGSLPHSQLPAISLYADRRNIQNTYLRSQR